MPNSRRKVMAGSELLLRTTLIFSFLITDVLGYNHPQLVSTTSIKPTQPAQAYLTTAAHPVSTSRGLTTGSGDLDPPQEVETGRESQQAYLTKYLTYEFWSQHLPDHPDPEFLNFIQAATPLTQKLRDKWLYKLAENQDWTEFDRYFRPTENLGLRCYAQMAKYQLEHQQAAVNHAAHLWLSPDSQASSACQHLMTYLLNEQAFSSAQIEQKIIWALEHDHIRLASDLLLKLPTHKQALTMLGLIQRNPKKILTLQPGPLAGSLYLYGLNQLLTTHQNMAVSYFKNPLAKQILSQAQQQHFLTRLTLYKAMHNHQDTLEWFAQVLPKYRHPPLNDWMIRYALMQQKWQTVLKITEHDSVEDADPLQRYWRARALDKLGLHSQAQPIYLGLAKHRNYYGFLASIALNKPLQFEFETTPHDLSSLTIYQPIIHQIAEFYRNKQPYLAAHMLNEFSLELTKTEKNALVYWVASDLKWPGKAIYLSSVDKAFNNQLSLRFPLAYQRTIERLAHQYQISPALIYATIRQESTFLDDSKSMAGAIGLMQILPATAKTIAQKAHIPYSDWQELYSAEKNLQIGTAYLKILQQRFNHHPILMMAAYNAGPTQVHRWQTHHNPQEIDIWIETLPWQETRNYLKNMLAFYAVYQYRLHQSPNLAPFLAPF